MRSLPWLLFITLLLCPFHLRRSSTATYYALGLVNVAPITRLMAPWAVRNHGRYTALFNVPEATTVDAPLTTAAPGGPSDATQAAAAESSPKSSPKAASPQQDTAQTASQKVPLLEGVWVPPSQNVAQRRGKIFSIQQPQDLLDFVIEDERLSVVKVYASWCKTCKVFDVRYRKLASQFGDKYDSKTGTEITQKGRVRFAEMQFDNPNNEEMCKVLNATKLPYIFLYKGSKGKMKEFQCSPTKFKMLTDAVNEYADPVVGDSEMNRELEKLPVLNRDDLEESPQDGNATIAAQSMSSNGEDTIEGLKQQLVTIENEKIEMFEIMKAQIEYDKTYIKKLETGVETQRSMLEAKDGEISNITTIMEQQHSVLKSKEEEMQTLTINFNHQREENHQAIDELSDYKSQVTQLTNRISELVETITSLEQESSINENAAQEKERQLIQQIEEREEEEELYEKERNSIRKLTMLGVKRVGRGIRSLVPRVRRK